MKQFKNWFQDQSGQTLTEYALILAVIAVGVIAVMVTLGDQIQAVFQNVIDSLSGSTSSESGSDTTTP